MKPSEDFNPAIQIFGHRFIVGQSSIEFLSEFFLIVYADKGFKADKGLKNEHNLSSIIFPDLQKIRDMYKNDKDNDPSIIYEANKHLDLKLFSFLGASRLATREIAHRRRFSDIKEILKKKIINSSNLSEDDILDTFRDLLLGFQGAGKGRTWCAQNFFPISKSLLAHETLWEISKSKQKDLDNEIKKCSIDGTNYWSIALKFFSYGKHLFLARGGELIYKQLCLAFSKTKDDIINWSKMENCESLFNLFSDVELSPDDLFYLLKDQLGRFLCNSKIDMVVSFIENNILDYDDIEFSPKQTTEIKSCPSSSWRISYMLAVEISRIMSLKLNVIEKITQLEILFDLHILRHLCHLAALQIEKQDNKENNLPLVSSWLRYALVLSPEEYSSNMLRNQSRISFRYIEQLLHDSIHSIPVPDDKSEEKFFKDSNKLYGFAVFRKIGKSMGMIIPRKGNGERMVLTESILRTLVLTLVRPESELTYTSFKTEIFNHFGLIFDREGTRTTMSEIGYPCDDLGHDVDSWVMEILDRAGMLIPLSDSCSLVRNPVAAE